MEKPGFVYIMANRRNVTLYIGVTSDLPKRIWEHRNDLIGGFSRRYGCHRLVWYGACGGIEHARKRELHMKEWKRAWKIREIEGLNPEWEDFFDRLDPM
ncbi:GIY-YIG nuclease family protein [Sphingomonas sp. 10B4]|uniref:GIY-YIG nuclease family protein n=1 Tax=Sphingomonas sp. 10B4 TaxID=3048575 RepID=UPI002AB5892E|nr:GIY-YIG nuclease family protein [Sphingomonas sp. 10B4]MDY7524925.1 GIY-YIG nuclease family protein [Sphingomonas sp. 10B4]MEB0282129.1 GIY-YIG nuclease family protein [Sphingomonas sp. 10B4]